MAQGILFDTIPMKKYENISKDELISLYEGEEKLRVKFQQEIALLEKELGLSKQRVLFLNNSYLTARNKLFGQSSEKTKKKRPNKGSKKPRKKDSKKRVLSLCERYHNLDVIDEEIKSEVIPECQQCNKEMKECSLTEVSDSLGVIPGKFYIKRTHRRKYRCSCCHESMATAPQLPKIVPQSSYSDEFILDVALSKFCDLIPVERYCQIAERMGLNKLPRNSLYQLLNKLAEFVSPVYSKIKLEIMISLIVHSDESPMKMLEGHEKRTWYFWGFLTKKSCYFKATSTRSGDTVSEYLKDSSCEYLVSDVYSGYQKSVKEINEDRSLFEMKKLLTNVFCNAHARRYFVQAERNSYEEASYFIKGYRVIYRIEDEIQSLIIKNEETLESLEVNLDELIKSLKTEGDSEKLNLLKELSRKRKWQVKCFNILEKKAIAIEESLPNQGALSKALKYFLKNLNGFKEFTKHIRVPIDNNPMERQLRNYVVGRKTWYGVHSEKAAETASILFSLVDSCKINKINPRKYFEELIRFIHKNSKYFTPHEYLLSTRGKDLSSLATPDPES